MGDGFRRVGGYFTHIGKTGGSDVPRCSKYKITHTGRVGNGGSSKIIENKQKKETNTCNLLVTKNNEKKTHKNQRKQNNIEKTKLLRK